MHYLILTFFMILSLLFIIPDVNVVAYFPPPLQQISDGVLPENVTCTEGLIIIVKISNNLPACVKPSSADELIERGWAVDTSLQLPKNSETQLDNDLSNEQIIVERAKAILDYALEKDQSESQGEYIQGPTDDGYQIAFYNVSGNNIILNELPSLPSTLLHLQQDIEKHQEIWKIFTKLIPESSRNVNIFYLTTDGEDVIGGGIERDVNNPSTWNLFYDIIDAYPTEVFDDKEIIYTTIHEFGHIVTSGLDQIDLDPELINFSTEDEIDELFQIKSKLCYPKTMVEDGCAKNESYINSFYQKFWTDIISDWDEIQYIEDDDEFYEQSDLFYEKYQNRFVSVYSSTNVDEDIAESWTAFVLNEKPIGETISEQKIQFFYDFSELVEIRNQIRQGLT